MVGNERSLRENLTLIIKHIICTTGKSTLIIKYWHARCSGWIFLWILIESLEKNQINQCAMNHQLFYVTFFFLFQICLKVIKHSDGKVNYIKDLKNEFFPGKWHKMHRLNITVMSLKTGVLAVLLITHLIKCPLTWLVIHKAI